MSPYKLPFLLMTAFACVSGHPVLAQLGDAQVSKLSAPASAQSGASVLVTYDVCNRGPGNFFANCPLNWTDRIYFNRSPSRSGARTLSSDIHCGLLFPGGCYSNIGINVPKSVQIPSGLGSGTYYIGYMVDATGVIPETNNSNNERWRAIKIDGLPDFTITALTANPTRWQPGVAVTVNLTVANQGGNLNNGSIPVELYLSPTIAPTGTLLYTFSPVLVSGGTSLPLAAKFAAPPVPNGCYYLVAVANPYGSVAETNPSNNSRATPIAFSPAASTRSFGSGCRGRLGSPVLSAVGLPTLGNPDFAIDVSSVQWQRVVGLFTGFSTSASYLGPLPLDLTPFGMPGCSLLVSPDIATAGFSGSSNSVRFGIPIPGDPATLGMKFYAQALVQDIGANALNVVASHGLECTIGK